MAINVSKKLADSYKFPNFPQLYFKIKTRPLHLKYREILRNSTKPSWAANDTGKPAIGPELDAQSEHFQKNHWAYVDKLWDEEFHKKLLAQWPSDQYFDPIQFITKSYDKGFLWNKDVGFPEHMDLFPAYKAAYEYLISDEFCKRIDAVMADGKERECYQIIMTRAYWGSSIIPHMDSLHDEGALNMVVFVNGTGGKDSGNLGIWKDNEFQDCIFEPENLTNSCLMYDMSTGFYHGFKPMRFGAFRWTMNAAYSVKK